MTILACDFCINVKYDAWNCRLCIFYQFRWSVKQCRQTIHIPKSTFGSLVSLCVTLFIVDWANALANPIAYLSNLEKHTQQLKVLTDDFDVKNDDKGLTDVAEQVSSHLWQGCTPAAEVTLSRRGGVRTSEADIARVCPATTMITSWDGEYANVIGILMAVNFLSLKVPMTMLWSYWYHF